MSQVTPGLLGSQSHAQEQFFPGRNTDVANDRIGLIAKGPRQEPNRSALVEVGITAGCVLIRILRRGDTQLPLPPCGSPVSVRLAVGHGIDGKDSWIGA